MLGLRARDPNSLEGAPAPTQPPPLALPTVKLLITQHRLSPPSTIAPSQRVLMETPWWLRWWSRYTVL